MTIYIASGWFNDTQAADLAAMKSICSGAPYYSPKDECLCPADAPGDFAQYVLESNVNAIAKSSLVFANVRHRDLGTVFEVGLAVALGVPVVFYSGEGLIAEVADAQRFVEQVKSGYVERMVDAGYVVIDTTDKNMLQLIAAGYAYGTGRRIVYFCPGLPPTAKFNLMLAKTAIAVCTDEADLNTVRKALAADANFSRPYTGLIE